LVLTSHYECLICALFINQSRPRQYHCRRVEFSGRCQYAEGGGERPRSTARDCSRLVCLATVSCYSKPGSNLLRSWPQRLQEPGIYTPRPRNCPDFVVSFPPLPCSVHPVKATMRRRQCLPGCLAHHRQARVYRIEYQSKSQGDAGMAANLRSRDQNRLVDKD